MGESDSYRYRAFLSYSSADRAWCERIHRAIERYRLPRRLVGTQTREGPVPARLAPVFRDRDDLSAAESLGAEIESALSASRFLLVLCSPQAAQSRWVNREIIHFKQQHGEGRVLAAICAGDPGSEDPVLQCFPPALRFRIGDDGEIGSQPVETLAADFRPEGDGFRHGLLKLAAGLVGVRLDELVQREAQRRSLRIRVVTGVLTLLVLTFAGIAWEALRQRDAARIAQAEAVHAREGAERLIELILTDLKNDVQAYGKLTSLTAIGERAAEYYAQQQADALSADQLGRRARVLLMLGEADNLRGNLDAALANYLRARDTTAEQLRRDPDNAQRIFDHAQSVFWVGEVAWQRGESDAARAAFTQYHELARQLVALEPDNDDWQLELNYALSNLGTLAREAGEASKAEAYFRQAVSLSAALLDKAPEEVERRLSVGTAHSWLADVLLDQLGLDGALKQRQRELDLYLAGQSLDSDDARLLLQEATTRHAIGILALNLGDLDRALTESQRAVEIQQVLAGRDPGNAQRTEALALARARLGEVLFFLGQSEAAEAQLRQVIVEGKALLEQDAGVTLWQRELMARPQWVLARLLQQRTAADPARARGLANAALQTVVALRQSSPDDVALRRAFGLALQAAIEVGAQPPTRWAEIAALFDEQDTRAEHLLLRAQAFLETGQTERAASPIQRLRAAGYRHPDFLALLARHPSTKAAASAAAEPAASPATPRSFP